MTNQRVCIIGGGPGGLASVKALNLEPSKSAIDLYELRSSFGGVWNYYPQKSKIRTDEEIKDNEIKDYSPVYKHLETNVIHELMAFSNFPFTCQNEFPTHEEVLKYLLDYSETIGDIDNLYFNHKVVEVIKIGNQWEVTAQSSKGSITKSYDYVIAANGHFYKPFYPEIPGLEQWHVNDPYSLTHAKFFNDGVDFKDKTVVLIGGFSSGSDIALHLSRYAKKIYVSLKPDAKVMGELDKINPFIEIIPEISSLDYESKTITTNDGQTIETDSIIVCAGYFYDLPFLKYSTICKKHYIDELYKQIFWYKDPSLMFLGLGRNVNPFPMIELQASVIARVITRRIPLPTMEEMEISYLEDIKQSGRGKSFHDYKPPKDLEYTKYWQDVIIQHQAQHGLNSPVYEGRRLELKMKAGEIKDQRIKSVNQKFLFKRGLISPSYP
ncbi:thiol-specific monooxygenase [[Candida] jaroonii]|uniref:Thiol-specific monooxygenase n=1 Tax=[Candida] jaroonii TaxID=467808 RepID=A0ACA9Y6G8_9ASCO|nr:thiol-specific monooxygenase [[Candida] jaroonii]